MFHLIAVLITGLIAGLIAERVMKRPHGVVVSIVIGIVGAWVGGFLADLVHLPAIGTGLVHWAFEIAVATVGAIVLLYIIGLIRRPSSV
jgi:uncharacterized membrane protein YeaQ/YmgE (transglycosylase-associated protein family)